MSSRTFIRLVQPQSTDTERLDHRPMPEQWEPPGEFDGYEVRACIGKGAMGRVYLAQDAVLDRPVAVKFIDALHADRSHKERFQVEGRAIARLQHPNVVAVYRVGEVDGFPYIASEFVRGDRLDEIPLPMDSARVLRIGLGLARGLAVAHRRGVLHRDIKPANVILSESSEVKLLDFGLAKLVEEADPNLLQGGFPALGRALAPVPSVPLSSEPLSDQDLEATRELQPVSENAGTQKEITHDGAVLGTPGYIAPEIWEGAPATFRSDVYSVGAVLYRLCTGSPPYHGRTLEDLRRAALTNEVKPLSGYEKVEPNLAAVIQRCLNRDPALRYASAEELREALEVLAPDARQVALPEGNPYRGLRAFEAEHQSLFFGRDTEIRAILERLRSDPFVLVAGTSGVGKSSLCRAGVIPRVCDLGLWDERRWSSVALTPGKRPILSLAMALAQYMGVDDLALTNALRQDPQEVYRELRKRERVHGPLLIFVDQLEELVTLASDADAGVMAQTLEAFSTPCTGLRLLATVRADFLVRVASLPGVSELVTRAMYLLKPMTSENVREAVVGPARAKGVAFESAAMVHELVDSTVQGEGALPLLQFALAELWEARDVSRGVIPGSALETSGGVTGALARHADAVVGGLTSEQRTAARRILSLVVTLEGTRARQTEEELGVDSPDRKSALAALVQGRLLTASESPEGPTYEVSHEALITSWPTLKRWLEEDAERRKMHERLATVIAEWERLGRRRVGLWGARQLGETRILARDDLSTRERAFLDASYRAVRLRRRVALASTAGLVLAFAGTYFGMQLKARRDLSAQVQALVNEGAGFLEKARSGNGEVEELRKKAFSLFDGMQVDRGEEVWERARKSAAAVDGLYAKAGQSLEAAVALGKNSQAAKSFLADVLYERALLAERDNRNETKEDLLARLHLYDDGSRRARWAAPGKVELDVEPAGTKVEVQYYREREGQNPVLENLNMNLTTPVGALELPQGSYLLTFSAPGRATTNAPVLIKRGDVKKLSFTIPPSQSVPKGYVYVPPSPFLFGSSMEDSMRRNYFNTVPQHQVVGQGYLIAQHETTFGDWLNYLNSFDGAEKLKRASVVGGTMGQVTLKPLGSDWILRLRLNTEHVMHLNDSLSLPRRPYRRDQNWLLLPAVGITLPEIEDFLAWLRRSQGLVGARICSEAEWEQAARGSDGREYPHGNFLASREANFFETYGRTPVTGGPDEVGAHPESRSPFGADDMSGNAWEFTRSSLTSGEYVIRGGAFNYVRDVLRTTNREIVSRTSSNVSTGFRVCGDSPAI